MNNFGEEIAYWYFRLNGFFLINNYVSHPSDQEGGRHADSDLLGIRTPHIKEVVGLFSPDEDVCPSLGGIMPHFKQQTVGIICEVKSGDNKASSLNAKKLASCIKRLGLAANENAVIDQLTDNPSFESADETVAIHKIFTYVTEANINHWHKIPLTTMADFIRARIHKYQEKGLGWNHYASNLFQYFLYEDKL